MKMFPVFAAEFSKPSTAAVPQQQHHHHHHHHVGGFLLGLVTTLLVLAVQDQTGISLSITSTSHSPAHALASSSSSSVLNTSSSTPASCHSDLLLTKLSNSIQHINARNAAAAAAADQASSTSAPRQKFFYKDLLTHFNVEPLSKSVIDPSIAHHLASHNIEMDETYEQDFEEEDWETVYGPLLDRGFEHDERLYAAFIDEDRGYGLFANIDILPGTLLGEYTGIITNASAGPTDYKWEYNSKPLIEVPAPLSESSSSNSSPSSSSSSFGTVYDLVELDLSLDARLAGNLLRFANHEDYPNADVVFIPYKNMWRIVYMSTHYIAKDEEISVHYGDEFWADEYEDEKIVTREWDQSYEDQEEEDPYYDLEDVEKEDEYEAEGDLEEEEEDVVIQHVFEFVDNEEELQSGEKQQEQVQQLDLNNKFLPFLASGKQQQQHQQLQRPLNFFNK